MKELKNIPNEELISETKSIAAEERKLGLELLKYLREIERRHLYAERYSSLFEFTVRELHYSEGAAYRRIQAMRLLKNLPEAEQSLENNEIYLCRDKARNLDKSTGPMPAYR